MDAKEWKSRAAGEYKSRKGEGRRSRRVDGPKSGSVEKERAVLQYKKKEKRGRGTGSAVEVTLALGLVATTRGVHDSRIEKNVAKIVLPPLSYADGRSWGDHSTRTGSRMVK